MPDVLRFDAEFWEFELLQLHFVGFTGGQRLKGANCQVYHTHHAKTNLYADLIVKKEKLTVISFIFSPTKVI